MKKTRKIKAFTLAETLITLMIIGVIAVMTVPALKEHSDEVKYVTAAKKAYASVNSAATAIEARHTDMAFWDCGEKTKKWFSEVLNAGPNSGAASWDHLQLDGTAISGNPTVTPDFYTLDGMAWQIGGTKGKCWVTVDTNGEKDPNITGIDQVQFLVGRSDNGNDFGVYPKGTPDHATDEGWCTFYIIKNDKMPWLREIGKGANCAAYY